MLELKTPAGRPDFAVLLEFAAEAYAELGLKLSETEADSLLELVGGGGHSRLWFLHLDGERIGFLVLCPCFSLEYGRHDAAIDIAYVFPGYRRKGLGRMIAFRARQAARAAGFDRLDLNGLRLRAPAAPTQTRLAA